MTRSICVFVQARMSSSRFPGKVLAPLFGRPLIQHVLGGVRQALPWSTDIVLVTSDEPSDDPLAVYVTALGVKVFRGPLEDVFARFRAAMRIYPHEYVLRICADSPFPNHNVLRRIAAHTSGNEYDLVTTTYPRTFARGQNAELIRAATFLSIDRHPERYRILNLSSQDPLSEPASLAVDRLDDLLRLERFTRSDVEAVTRVRHRDIAATTEVTPSC
jgi:spore coat polysaccharide biosynthesis protein SpsF